MIQRFSNIIFLTNYEYEEITKVSNQDAVIEYGIIKGSSTIVFIKTGFEGSIYGYENKYLKIAEDLHTLHGVTVIVSSNSSGLLEDFDSGMNFIKDYAERHNLKNYQVYYMGHSLGATLGIINAWKYPEIQKLVLINGPLFLDPEILIEGMNKYNGEKMHLVYGSKDLSFSQANLFSEYESEKVVFTRVEGADHHFTGCLDFFMSLPGFYFFDDEINVLGVKKNLDQKKPC